MFSGRDTFNTHTGRNILAAFLLTSVILWLGYYSFGFWVMMIFSSGFLGGFFVWLFFPSRADFDKLKFPFWIAFALFIIHRVEEKKTGFFDFLSKVTEIPTPEITSWNVILLVGLSVGTWLVIPLMIKRKIDLGYYLAWTFFVSMGVTELAHWLVFPFLVDEPFGYIPGMASVVILAPVAWWGIRRLHRAARVQ